MLHNSIFHHNSHPPLVVSGNDTVISGNDIHANMTAPAGIAIDGTGIVLEDGYISNDYGFWIAVSISGQGNTVRNVTTLGGISVSGDQHLIENNSVAHYYDGIYVSGVGNVIRRNIMSGWTMPRFVDMRGTPTTCTDNKWLNNTFTTADPLCIR